MIGKGSQGRGLHIVSMVLGIAIVSWAGYFGSRHLESHDLLQQGMAGLFGTTYFLSIALGASYVYTALYLRGTGFWKRLAAAFVVPFLWMTKEMLLLTESHPFGECLYWYVNPLNIWLALFVIFQAGVGTMIARRIMRGRGNETRAVTAGPVIVSLVSLFLIIALFAWGKGENVYALFLEGYRVIFGSGV